MPKSVYDILEDLNDDIAMQIWNCVAKGEDVEAIRQLKAATGLTLKQARDMITALKGMKIALEKASLIQPTQRISAIGDRGNACSGLDAGGLLWRIKLCPLHRPHRWARFFFGAWFACAFGVSVLL